jgi:hypothetical protein
MLAFAMASAALMLLSTMTQTTAITFNPDLVQGRICLSAVQANMLMNTETLRSKEGVVAVSEIAMTKNMCRTSPSSELLAAHGYSIPAQYATALAAVAHYRAKGQTNDDALGDSNTEVIIYAYAASFIIIATSEKSPDPPALSCAGSHYYRVTLSTNQVYEFDGCVEGHERTLPAFSKLPPMT